jgi:hypothetical protein
VITAQDEREGSAKGWPDEAIWARAGLVGGTGFVGGNLRVQRPFARHYSSSTIDQIAGERFSTLICAGAPATMWAANADPEGDRANLRRLADRIASARFDRLVLISTIAVLDDMSAGYTESSARFEGDKAYGRNRRELEATLAERHGAVVVRLPALFGEGLRKNFVFDLLNPVPSFLAPAKYEALRHGFTEEERSLASRVYSLDEPLGMMRLDRDRLDRTPAQSLLTAAFSRSGFTARDFTNSRSAFQFYDLSRLAQDLERCLDASLRLLHLCSEPLGADDLHRALLGEGFRSDGPAAVHEDMRSDHSHLWGSSTAYLYTREETLSGLLRFMRPRLT